MSSSRQTHDSTIRMLSRIPSCCIFNEKKCTRQIGNKKVQLVDKNKFNSRPFKMTFIFP